ncbi:MAG: hypothetical protein ACLRIL_10465 [Fusicatenibacter saccharivorans]
MDSKKLPLMKRARTAVPFLSAWGYKTLWLILSCIKVPTQDAPFDVLKGKAMKQMEKSEREKERQKRLLRKNFRPSLPMWLQIRTSSDTWTTLPVIFT